MLYFCFRKHVHVVVLSLLGVVVDPETMTQKGYVKYDDDNLGIPRNNPQYQLTNNPAHEHTETDGTLWSTVTAVKFNSQTALSLWYIF